MFSVCPFMSSCQVQFRYVNTGLITMNEIKKQSHAHTQVLNEYGGCLQFLCCICMCTFLLPVYSTVSVVQCC